jgi:hypothetical protein
VRAASGLPAGFFILWCHDVAEVVDGLRKLVVDGIVGVGFGYAVEVVLNWLCSCSNGGSCLCSAGEGSR